MSELNLASMCWRQCTLCALYSQTVVGRSSHPLAHATHQRISIYGPTFVKQLSIGKSMHASLSVHVQGIRSAYSGWTSKRSPAKAIYRVFAVDGFDERGNPTGTQFFAAKAPRTSMPGSTGVASATVSERARHWSTSVSIRPRTRTWRCSAMWSNIQRCVMSPC
jgi:hypothetical protein